MFHNVLMTTLTPIRDANEIHYGNSKPFTTMWPGTQLEKVKETSVRKTIKKKKRNRTMFTTEQVRVLEKVFARTKYVDVERRRELSECLQIQQKCIKIWFQNRRMKEKKELSESCDSTSESPISSLESLSPPLESTKPSNNESDLDYTGPHVDSHVSTHYYYNPPNEYPEADLHQFEPNLYETSNNPTYPDHLNYNNNNFNSNIMRNNTDYSAQYYPTQTEFQYYYNTSDLNSPYIMANVRDWPANIFDTSYF